jgi:dTDP-4-dehydrorhamnose reductase
MKVLVTGAGGQIGSDLVPLLREQGVNVVATTRSEIDFCRPAELKEAVSTIRPDWVVNCAAYTKVDLAEREREQAFLINRDAVSSLARVAAEVGAALLHISTDFVFGGDQGRPYAESDPVEPLSVYAQSKWEGEEAVRQAGGRHIILRTAWVYGVRGHNFVKTILRLASERDRLEVVDEQIGTPTWSRDVAGVITELIVTQRIRPVPEGTYHFTNEGVASWYDFANAILEEGRRLGFPIRAREVVPIPVEAYPLPARRPYFSVLNKQKIREYLRQPIPHWRDSLRRMLETLREKSSVK